jgi:hypothetical protein
MMRTLKKCSLPVSLLVIFLAAGQGKAEFVTATLNGTGLNDILNPGAWVTINLGDGSAPTLNYKPGMVNWKGVPTNSAPFQGKFTTFCLELTQDINPGTPYTYSLVSLQNAPKPGSSQTGGAGGMGNIKADEIRKLWGAFYSSINGDGTKAAAFQLAIWKIENDWGGSGTSATDFTLGNFRASGNTSATDQASTWLTDLTKPNTYAPDKTLMALTSDSYQDQLVSVPVPVPPSLWLASIGVLCLICYGCLIERARRFPIGKALCRVAAENG